MSLRDSLIENYFLYRFTCRKTTFKPRNLDVEKEIIELSKIEFILECSIHTNEKKYFNNHQGVINSTDTSTKYTICIENGVFRDVEYVPARSSCKMFDFLPIKFKALFPLVELHSRINNVDIKKSVDILTKEGALSETIDVNYDFDLIGWDHLLQKSIICHELTCKSEYADSIRNFPIIATIIDGRKILIPVFIVKRPLSCDTKSFFFLPMKHGKARLMHLLDLERNPESVVILSDSPELASYNQVYSPKDEEMNITWVSFYTENGKLPPIDWTPLKNRVIYYPLIVHSGFTAENIYAIAEEVRRELINIGASDFKYITIPTANPKCHSNENITARVFNRYLASYIPDCLAKIIENLKSGHTFLANEYSLENKIILHPLVYERTITLIYGNIYAGKTIFSLCLAAAVSNNAKAFEGWKPTNSHHVLYVYCGDDNELSFLEKCKTLTSYGQHIATPPAQFEGYMKISDMLDILIVEKCFNEFEQQVNLINAISKIPEESKHQYMNDHGVIIIDGIIPEKATKYEGSWNPLIREYRGINWAVIIVSRTKPDHRKKDDIRNDIPLDSILRLEKCKTRDPAKPLFSVFIEKGFKLPRTSSTRFKCELNTDVTPHILVRVAKEKSRTAISSAKRSELIDQIKSLYAADKKLPVAEAAIRLHISLSLLKKLKREAGCILKKRKNANTFFSHLSM